MTIGRAPQILIDIDFARMVLARKIWLPRKRPTHGGRRMDGKLGQRVHRALLAGYCAAMMAVSSTAWGSTINQNT